MKSIELSEKQLRKLEKIKLDDAISNKEGSLYYLDSIGYSDLLLKRLFITSKEVFANKLFTISMLGDYEKEIGIDELVVPKHLVIVSNNVIGFTVKEVKDTTNLGLILHDEKVSIDKKIKYLSKVGQLLKKTKNLLKDGINFYFNDLHEYNFLIGNEDEKLYAVDLDSVALNDDYPLPSHYVFINPNLGSIQGKYACNAYGINYPNYDSDLLCYHMMILNTISGVNISQLNMSDYFDYTNYLEQLGFGKDIINSFQIVYSEDFNINPVEFFDQIPIDGIHEADFKVYQMKKNNGKIKC